MGTTITIDAGPGAVVVITGDGVYVGCTYDVFEGWYGVSNVDVDTSPRPNAPGVFAPEQTFPGEKAISIEGQFYGATARDALLMREALSGLYNDGQPVTMTVADDLRTTSRQVLIESVVFPWTIHPEFNFTIDAVAEDPRRYDLAPDTTITTGLAAPGTGLGWPLVWPADWGTIGVDGKVVVTNPGNTETVSTYTITGGALPDGFIIVNVTTGERLTYVGPLAQGSTIVLDGDTRTATIDGTGPGSRYLSAPEWWAVPKRSEVQLQFLARGAVIGNPTLTVTTPPAYY